MKNPFKVMSLQVSFFSSFIVISAVLITILGLTSYYTTNQEVVDKTISSRILLLDEINKQIDFQTQSIEYDSLVVASNPTIRNYLEENEFSFERIGQNAEIIDLLSRHSYIKEAIHSVQLYAKNSTTSTYVGANGVFDYSIIEASPSYSYIQQSDSVWLGAHELENGSYLSIDEQVVSFYRKVLSSAGKEIGILVFNMKLSYMQELISAASTDSNRYILDSSMRLIVEAVDEEMERIPYAAVEEQLVQLINTPNEGENYAIHTVADKQLIIWNKQSRTQWLAMDMIPWEQVTQGSAKIKTTIIYTVIVCVLLAILLTFTLSKQLVTPIKGLVQAMRRLKSGKMDSRVQNDYVNEIGYLNQHFNSMASEIEDLITQLDQQHRMKREADLKVLQEQMNPHFLYNTLDIMNWHAISIGANDISRMLSLLGKMLRIGLASGATFISLDREVEHLNCYVELQKIRYQDFIEFELETDPALSHYFVPKLILQPLVENSIIHGFHSRRVGKIHIQIVKIDEQLKLTITDNGHGIAEGKDIYAAQHHGLRNVKERIELYFGDQYGLQIDSKPDLGTTITITLPLIENISAEWLHTREDQTAHD